MSALSFDQPQDMPAPRVSFVPMIDVVLQIICFYLFVSSGVQSYQATDVQLPLMTHPSVAAERPATLTINLAADGSLDLNGEPVAINDLASRLAAAKAAEGEMIVAIRADRRQRFGLLDQVLQAARGAGVPTVTIRSLGAREGP